QAAYQHVAGDKTNSILDQAFVLGTDAPSSTANQIAVRLALRHKF
ncbi:MAG: porin, partial [Trinickia sp.]